MNQKNNESYPDHTEVKDERLASGEHHHQGKSSETRLDKTTIRSLLEISPGQIILDAGCGNGYMSKEFSEAVGDTGKVYALDPDETSITTLREEAGDANIEAFVGDITATTKLLESSLDLIYISNVFHGFTAEQIKGFNKEVNRILKPDGRLAIVEIVKRDTPFGPPLAIRVSPVELTQMLSLAPIVTMELGEHFYMQIFEKRARN